MKEENYLGNEEEDNRSWNERAPPEVWKQILSKLKHCSKEVLICRQVCYAWKQLSDEILKSAAASSLWTTSFSRENELFDKAGKLPKLFGTRFTTAEQVTQFFSEMSNFKGYPFPNGMVIFSAKHFGDKERRAFYLESFEKLVNSFGKWITSLVYYLKMGHDENSYYSQLKNVLKISRLENLIIYTYYLPRFDLDKLVDLFSVRGFEIPQNLRQLQIYESKEMAGAPLILLFTYLAPILNFVKMLRFSWRYDVSYLLTEERKKCFKTPKLRKLKILMPCEKIMEHFCCPNVNYEPPRLEEISVNLSDEMYCYNQKMAVTGSEIMGRVEKICACLDCYHGKTLEIFNLSVNFSVLEDNLKDLKINLNEATKYLKLKWFYGSRIMFCGANRLISCLSGKLNSVEMLTVEFVDKEVDKNEEYQEMISLFNQNQVCPVLREIHVPELGWIIKKTKNEIIFKEFLNEE